MAEEKRLALLRSTVRSVAKYGMKDVSTRSISGDAGVNDAYIYRYFQDKEDLLKQAYLMENDKFMRVVLQRMELIRNQSTGCTQQERFRLIFHVAWRYLIDTPDVCRFFLYYYNSPNFEKYARKEYHEQLNLLAEKFCHYSDRQRLQSITFTHCLFCSIRSHFRLYLERCQMI